VILSEHFTLTELTKTNSGLTNILTQAATINLVKLAETLEQIRALFDNKAITINSAMLLIKRLADHPQAITLTA
jgi:hypothetical protein